MKKLCTLLLISLMLVACNNTSNNTSDSKNPVVVMTMANNETVEIELYPDMAPKTVENFLNLVDEKFYDGLTFHRIIPNFMVQGGDPLGNGMGGSPTKITGEFAANGFKDNTLKHTEGVISMARAQDPNSASSQFFIMTQDTPSLDGQYAAFGKVISGMDTVKNIEKTPTGPQDAPQAGQEQVISSITRK